MSNPFEQWAPNAPQNGQQSAPPPDQQASARSNPFDQYTGPASPGGDSPFSAPTTPSGQNPPQWGAGENFLSGAVLGAGPRVLAAESWIKKNAPDWVGEYVIGHDMPAEDYGAALKRYQGEQGAWATAHPVANVATNLAGGMVPAAITGGLVNPFESTIANMATQGAVLGGLSNAAQGETNPAAYATDMATGAALGAGTGALGRYVVKPGMEAFQNWRYGRSAAGQAMPGQTADALLSTFQNAKQTPDQAAQALDALGPGAALADTSRGAQEQTARLAANFPHTADTIESNLTDRAQMFDPRLQAVVNQNAGPWRNPVQDLQDLQAITRANGNAAYGPIMNSGATVDLSPVQHMAAAERAPFIINQAQESPTAQAMARVQNMIGPNYNNVPIDLAHSVQDQMDDMASSAFRAGNTSQARTLWQARQALLDQMPPEYNAARAQYASDKAIENAFQNGRDVFSSRLEGQVYDPSLLEARLAGMTPNGPERQAFNMGVRNALQDQMLTARTDVAGLSQKLSNQNGYAADKLRQAIGQQQADNIIGEVENIKNMQATNNLALAGSKTGMMRAVDESIPQAKNINPFDLHNIGPAGAVLGAAHAGVSPMLAAAGMVPLKLGSAAWNASRQAGAKTARDALAEALTGAYTPELRAAVAARQGFQQAGAQMLPGAQNVVGALAGGTSAAQARNLRRNFTPFY